MWQGYNPTKKERDAIEGAYSYLAFYQVREYELDQWMKQERKGYGNPRDAIPTIGAKALCVKWFYQGVKNPAALARDVYALRPAAAWLIGHGAYKSTCAPAINMTALENAIAAHEAAFKRMHEKDMADLKAAYSGEANHAA